jgi:hypothetical protein
VSNLHPSQAIGCADLLGAFVPVPQLTRFCAHSGRTEDFEDLLDEDGNPVTHPSGNISKALHTPWFQCSWLYSRSSFVALKGKNAQYV